jgi:hypothetical protein
VPRDLRPCSGGLTEALALAAKGQGLRIDGRRHDRHVVWDCAGAARRAEAEIVDLDGPLHLASDRVPGLRYDGSTIHPPDQSFWGQPT